jgi:hypothetical protein
MGADQASWKRGRASLPQFVMAMSGDRTVSSGQWPGGCEGEAGPGPLLRHERKCAKSPIKTLSHDLKVAEEGLNASAAEPFRAPAAHGAGGASVAQPFGLPMRLQ